ncbi:hypothetical protein ABIE56_000276 [Luteibacter sp. 621]
MQSDDYIAIMLHILERHVYKTAGAVSWTMVAMVRNPGEQ